MTTWPTDQYVTVESDERQAGTVLQVRLDRPEKLNALPFSSVGTLTDLFEQVDRSDADAVEITGTGENFCVGMDVESATREEFLDPTESGSVHDLVAAIRDAPVPVVAAVRGKAFGTGFFVCMAADFVVATPGAAFSLPEVKLGMPAGAYTPALLPGIVGEKRAREWLLTGAAVDAEEAAEAGFVTTVAGDEPLDETARELLATLLDNSGLAMALVKEELASALSDPAAVKEHETDAMRTAWEDGDVADRIDDLF